MMTQQPCQPQLVTILPPRHIPGGSPCVRQCYNPRPARLLPDAASAPMCSEPISLLRHLLGSLPERWAALMVITILGLAQLACTPIIQTDGPRIHASHSEAPLASNFPARPQLRLQAGQHWQLIAQDSAQSLAAHLFKNQRCNRATHPCRPLHLAEPEHVTEFSRAFSNALITALVQQGINVSRAPDAALVLHLDVQPVRFAPNRPQYRHAGVARELGPGIWALQDVAQARPAGATADTTSSPQPPDALHWFRTEFSAGATPQTEIIVTLSAMDGLRYAARSTNVYYVTETDLHLYDREICSLIRPCPEKILDAAGQPIPRIRTGALNITGDCPLDKPCCPPNQVCPNQP